MYKLRNFSIQEFVPKEIYLELGEKSIFLMDERVLITCDLLRDALGPMIINTWHSEALIKAYGLRNEAGFRLSSTATGAKWSQHKFGRAVDGLFKNHTPEQARQYVIKNLDKFPLITAIEKGVNWLHFDVRSTNSSDLFLFSV